MPDIPTLSQTLVDAFARIVPLHGHPTHGKKRLTKAEIATLSEAHLQFFLEQARQIRTQHRLGLLTRARLALAVQQQLLTLGYPAPLVKQVLFALLTAAFTGR